MYGISETTPAARQRTAQASAFAAQWPPVTRTSAPMPRILDHALPVHEHGQSLPRHEDPELTAYLHRHIRAVFSRDTTPPPCYYCSSQQVALRYRGLPPNGIPYFTCKRCGKGFNRRTGTALQSFLRSDKLDAFLPLLSQQRSIASAGEMLGVSASMLKRWVRVFRKWLLKLDPSGEWEARVKLGMVPDLPHLQCPNCGNREHFFRHGFVDGNHQGKRMFRCKLCRRCVTEPDAHFSQRKADAESLETASRCDTAKSAAR
ncbi:DUF746 domain-containing protein [Pseudomonas panipatensis]|uniref:DUF746 domain-containing protein n=1 Tax=Pseudomonas panipatensis TaxID=428992 RepID=UPI0035B1DB1A